MAIRRQSIVEKLFQDQHLGWTDFPGGHDGLVRPSHNLKTVSTNSQAPGANHEAGDHSYEPRRTQPQFLKLTDLARAKGSQLWQMLEFQRFAACAAMRTHWADPIIRPGGGSVSRYGTKSYVRS